MSFLVIFTDGSAPNNGAIDARGGVGVFFGVDDPRNVSKPLIGDVLTNNRAELTALIYALTYVANEHPSDGDVVIKSDSKYCINGYGWVSGWNTCGWTTSAGTEVKNRDLWEKVLALKPKIESRSGKFELSWVRGHSGNKGNQMADSLAKAGARKRKFDRIGSAPVCRNVDCVDPNFEWWNDLHCVLHLLRFLHEEQPTTSVCRNVSDVIDFLENAKEWSSEWCLALWDEKEEDSPWVKHVKQICPIFSAFVQKQQPRSETQAVS